MPTRSRTGARRAATPSRPARGSAGRRGGLSVKTYSGLNEKRMQQKSGGNRVVIEKGSTIPVQFLQKVSEFVEFDQHSWQEGGQWWYVPCTGDETCEPCQSEDEKKRKKGYKFLANVFNLKERKVQILEGPKTLATQIFYKYQRKPVAFLKRVYDITKFPTNPISYNFELAEEQAVKTAGLKLLDLNDYLDSQLDRYYGEGGEAPAKGGANSLDDTEYDEDEEYDGDDDDDLLAYGEEADEGDRDAIRHLTKLAKQNDLDPDDYPTWVELAEALSEDEGDEDEDEEEEDGDEPSEEEMMDKDEWSWSDLKAYAEELGVRKQTKIRSELVRAIIRKRG